MTDDTYSKEVIEALELTVDLTIEELEEVVNHFITKEEQ